MTAAALPATRRVRVTVEGDARPLAHQPDLLRVEHDGGQVLVVDTRAESTVVEDVERPRVWTDGDVVQHPSQGWTVTRQGGRWVSSTGADCWTDARVTNCVDRAYLGYGQLMALRYQAGEQ